MPHEISVTKIFKKSVLLYVGERFSGREVDEQDHQQTSKLATERKVEWNFQRKEKYFC